MSINTGIIDQRVRKLAQDLAPELESRLNIRNDEDKQRSTAFVFLVTKTILDLTDEEALDCLTEGGNDFGVDALHVGDVENGEFVTTLFQGKYKRDLDGNANFPQTGVEKVIQAIRYLFDPDTAITANPRLAARIEEIRSLIRDGQMPRVRVVLCNNGLTWHQTAQQLIEQTGFSTQQVIWEHVNHDRLFEIIHAPRKVNDNLQMVGKAVVEGFDYRRVFIGKMAVRDIEALFNRHGDDLLERNVRRFLGLQGNRVNQAIAQTLQNETERPNFYFYNNGITLLCEKFSHNEFQKENFLVRVEGLQVINGGQTCKTIQSICSSLPGSPTPRDIEKAFVLVRLYELPGDSMDLVRSITYATNSQNPVDLRDLRSNDTMQKSLETAINQLGFTYHRHRSETSLRSDDISTAIAAVAVLSVWRQRPHQAKFQGGEHFGKLYEQIFTPDLNGTQVVLATLLFRFTENKRRRPPAGSPDFVPYASCFAAMLMGRYLLADLGIQLKDLNHLKFAAAKAKLEAEDENYFNQAIVAIDTAIKRIYGVQTVSLQRLSATFRRGDLVQELH